jgi:hypothetical protein
MAQSVCVVINAADRERLAAIVAPARRHRCANARHPRAHLARHARAREGLTNSAATAYSITSSARASSDGGMVRFSARDVFKLM